MTKNWDYELPTKTNSYVVIYYLAGTFNKKNRIMWKVDGQEPIYSPEPISLSHLPWINAFTYDKKNHNIWRLDPR